jgi:hypothetical protein
MRLGPRRYFGGFGDHPHTRFATARAEDDPTEVLFADHDRSGIAVVCAWFAAETPANNATAATSSASLFLIFNNPSLATLLGLDLFSRTFWISGTSKRLRRILPQFRTKSTEDARFGSDRSMSPLDSTDRSRRRAAPAATGESQGMVETVSNGDCYQD